MTTSNKIKIVVGVALILVVLGKFGFLNPVQNFVVWATKPFFEFARTVTVKVGHSYTTLTKIGDLQKENNDLRQRIVLLEAENASLKSNTGLTDQLQQALNLKTRTGYEVTGARVVSSDPTSFNQTLLVDRGSGAGVVEGQAVVDDAGALIGRVTRVLTNTSEITLISDTSSRMPGELPDSNARGIIAGQHALSVALIEVPQGQDLPVGGKIITTGFTPGVPAGLLIGYVDSLRSKSGDLFQEANVRPAADLRQLRIVFIITKSQ